MSLYNILFGVNPLAPTLLRVLGIRMEDVGRFRDAFVTEGKIAIYTRLGSHNAECCCDEYPDAEPHPLDPRHKCVCYVPNINLLRRHPLYLYDEEDGFDRTYRTFYFRIPEEFKELFAHLDEGKIDFDERWLNKLKSIEDMSPDQLRACFPQLAELVEKIEKKIQEASSRQSGAQRV